MSRRFVLIDRDGTLNVEKNYLSDPEGMELIPGAAEAIRRFKTLGLGVVVVTNQSGLARGYFDQATLDKVHERMYELLKAEGAEIDGLYICPHGPEDECDCRKPLPGMVQQAVAEHGFDPEFSIMIGDKDADIGLGRAVGALTILVRTGHGADTEWQGEISPDYVVDDLLAAVGVIENLLGGPIN